MGYGQESCEAQIRAVGMQQAGVKQDGGALQGMHKYLEVVHQRFGASVNNLSNMADRILGTVPTKADCGEKNGPAETDVARINEALRRLDSIADMLASVTERLSRL